MSKLLKTEALVLRKRSLLHQDSLITLFSKEFGKVVMIAKGMKKITSRRAPHIQTGNLIEAILSRKNDRLYLQQSALISAFSQIKKDKDKMDYLYLYLFVLDRLLPEEQEEGEIFSLAKKFLVNLSNTSPYERSHFTPYFQEILSTLGYSKGEQSFEDLVRLVEEVINEKVPTDSL